LKPETIKERLTKLRKIKATKFITERFKNSQSILSGISLKSNNQKIQNLNYYCKTVDREL